VTHRHADYIPAAGHDFFLPLYDPVLRLLMRERALRTRFLDLAAIQPGQRVLDLGCGTATLLLLLKERCPSAEVVGVDGDPKVLAFARAKAEKQGVAIRFDEALATQLPYGDASFDRVLSSLMLHHLTRDEKLQALREARRVLAPGASFHLVDFGPPRNWLARGVVRALSHGERMADNLAGRLPELMREAGFARVEERGHHGSVFGTLVFISGWIA
jgi:ubiquinone/menaquinone biosynthesis C-methylase UbiE